MNTSGLVLKITDTHIVLLTEKGTFKNVPHPASINEIPLIGQRYTHYEQRKRNYNIFLKYGSTAAALCLIILAYFLFPNGGSAEETYIITLDINPSIELSTNEKDEIIRAEGLNSEGVEILARLSLESNVYDALKQIISETVELGYVQDGDSLISTSIVPKNDQTADITPKIKATIEDTLVLTNTTSDVSVVNDQRSTYEQAKEAKVSINYYKELVNLEEKGIDIDEEEIQGKSLADLKKIENNEEKSKKREVENSPSNDRPVKKDNNGTNKEINQEKGSPGNQKEKPKNHPSQAVETPRSNKQNQGNSPSENPSQTKNREQPNDPKKPPKDRKKE
ncbi:anti-sigma-I factor RsgI family protein [Bacillus solitudinis]|uniref:anti-sigma-I factor RsgI family protein n=1 Tax=Bacillus solitudinis TaxID=2014074 RepID=UPI000C2442F0|nr:hypothetical protein [Bacillus solitudinis]